MVRDSYRASTALRVSAVALAGVIGFLAVGTDPADAKARKKRSKQSVSISKSVGKVSRAAARESRNSYNPPYSAIVVDANTGKTLHEASPDAPRHPASLTKIMTLYLLFERLEAGKIKLDNQMPVSSHAASQDPTKLGLRPGQTLAVEDAIKGLVTKSANDAAVVIAETLGGDEDDFAEMMTAKARALGMSRTTYRNASGLPNSEQITTARDQATLGRAIQDRFPKYYRYFSTSSFTYRGNTMGNHNRLLGRVEGVDGIKTGYTRASGFNLVTSVKRDGRYLVSVVLGGSSGGARDARMKTLIAQNIATGATRRTAPMVAELETGRGAVEVAAAQRPTREVASAMPSSELYQVASGESRAAPAPRATGPSPLAALFSSQPQTGAANDRSDSARVEAIRKETARPDAKPSVGSAEPIKPVAVRTVKVMFGGVQMAALGAQIVPRPADDTRTAAVRSEGATTSVARTPAPAVEPEPAPARMAARTDTTRTETKRETKAAAASGGWVIQIGAFGAESEAKSKLSAAQSKAKGALRRAEPRAEAAKKGGKTFYRARFAGLDKEQAEAACKQLKHNDIACITIRN